MPRLFWDLARRVVFGLFYLEISDIDYESSKLIAIPYATFSYSAFYIISLVQAYASGKDMI